MKIIEQIIGPPPPHMVGDGFRVHNFFPSRSDWALNRLSPFFLMDYNSPFYFEPTQNPRGVGVHPHRGFETVTIAYQGKVAHHDSTGNSGIIGTGDVQWMTAASGVLHKEYHEENFSKAGGVFQMVQLWVNLPAEYKMSKPKYQAIKHSEMGIHTLENKGYVNVIAGELLGTKGPATTFTPIHMYNMYLQKGNNINFSLPINYNTCMLIIKGSAIINNKLAQTDHLVLFKNEGETIEVSTDEESIILVLSGEPINEPIEAGGPFVMNTKRELMQAYHDVQNGLFGYLE